MASIGLGRASIEFNTSSGDQGNANSLDIRERSVLTRKGRFHLETASVANIEHGSTLLYTATVTIVPAFKTTVRREDRNNKVG